MVTGKKRIIFVTGTDTGVGKTLFTGLFLRHLRAKGIDAVALKPFCSGSRDDVEFLQSLQPGALPDEIVNPIYIDDPVAPYVALRKKNSSAASVVNLIRGLNHEVILVEGSGGVLVPLFKNFLVVDLIEALKAEVILVSRNRLGTINHTLLSNQALKKLKPRIVLMDQSEPDDSSKTNLQILRDFLPKTPIHAFPFLRANVLRKNPQAEKVFQKVFAFK